MSDTDLEDLPGVGSKTAEKLRDAGYDGLMSIATMSAADLSEVADLGNKTANKIIQAAREELDLGFQKGSDKMAERENMSKITLSSTKFDDLLDGGVETQSITEFYGEFGSAKTQCALQLAVNAQLPEEEGGLDQGVIFIDTEDTFIPERVEQMAEAKNMDPDDVLDNIFVARAYNSDHQILLGDKAQDIMKDNDIGLIVVDSLTSQFRSDYVGRGQLADRQQKLNEHMHTLQRLANTHNAAVVVTNQVMSNPGQLFGDPTSAIGGHIVGHASAFRIYLRKSKKNKRIARLVDCPYLPEGEAVFQVTENGIEDA
ncbi:MAG: DNA repair and recombination protein RadA [Candidatus Nanohaloarchaeota archaeon QJJ-5]|nr:DNA repair and recombination protein RadA [Candidatus Nanohaloarchaeota archaeon QJJ-5]